MAFRSNYTDTLLVFMECGWDINEAGPRMGMRPLLRHAVNDRDMRAFLLANGASPNIENNRRCTPLETAAGWSSTEIVEELILHGSDPTKDDSILAAVEMGRLGNVKLLVAHGADVNLLEKEYHPPWNRRARQTVLGTARYGSYGDSTLATNNMERRRLRGSNMIRECSLENTG